MGRIHFGTVNRILLFGGGRNFGRLVSELSSQSISVVVISSPRHLNEPYESGGPLREYLNDIGATVIETEEILGNRDVDAMIDSNTIGISVGAAWIFTKAFIDRFEGRLLNIHGTKLPQNRGGGGFSWQILMGEIQGNFVIHQVVPGIDKGAIVYSREYMYPASCKIPLDFEKVSSDKFFAFVSDFISKIREGVEFDLRDQQEEFSTYWPRLSTDHHGFVDWSWRLGEIVRFICAFDEPYKGASSYVNEHRVRLRGCRTTTSDGLFHPFQTGIIYRKRSGTIYVATPEGGLLIQDLRNEAGANVYSETQVGDRFYTPFADLEYAKSFRAIYTPTGLRKTVRGDAGE